MNSSPDQARPAGDAQFTTTHWSVVVCAGDPSAPNAQQALAKLCRDYWYPLYVYVRSRGHAPADAQDLTQGFFAGLIEKNYLERAEKERGRFRWFLLTSLQNYLHNERDRAHAQKRGGGRELVSWDELVAEERFHLEPADQMSPDKLFEKRWAATLLEKVIERLQREFSVAGKEELFTRLKPHLGGAGDAAAYAKIAAGLGMTVVAIKVTVHRLRHRYREILREEIAHTVARPEDVEDEIRCLLQVMSE